MCSDTHTLNILNILIRSERYHSHCNAFFYFVKFNLTFLYEICMMWYRIVRFVDLLQIFQVKTAVFLEVRWKIKNKLLTN